MSNQDNTFKSFLWTERKTFSVFRFSLNEAQRRAHVYGLPLYPRRIVSSRRLELLLRHMRTPTLPLAHDVLCPPAFAQPCPSILRSRGLHTLSAGKTLPQSRFFRFQHKHIIVQKIDLCQWTGAVKVFHRLYKYHINIFQLVQSITIAISVSD